MNEESQPIVRVVPLDENGRPEILVPEYLDVPLEEYKQVMEEMHQELDKANQDEGVLRRNG